MEPPGWIGDDGDDEGTNIPLVSLAPCDVVNDPTAEDRGKQQVIMNMKQQLVDKHVEFLDALKEHCSKTFADLYKAIISATHNVQKTIKADRKLLQQLLNAVNHR